jgi:hypothetical protein
MNNFKIVKRYILFYLSIAVLFSVWSYALDVIFYKIDYGGKYKSRATGFEYFVWFIGLYTIVALPICILYNTVMNSESLENIKWVRYIIAISVGLLIGFIMGRSGFSYYIGEYKALKHLILFPLILLSAEIIRNFVVKYRYSKNKT